MLPRRLRLSRRGMSGLRHPMRTTSPHFSVAWSDSVHTGGATVVIPKKVVQSAVGRNRMKRRIRPLLLPYLGAKRALIVYVRPGAKTILFPTLREELISLLDRLPKTRDGHQ